LVPRFLERYPDIQLEVEMGAELPGVPGEEWDVLIQNGAPAVEGLVATSLGQPPVILCAVPAYLKAHPAPHKPEELNAHALLMPGTSASVLRLQKGRQQAELRITPRLVVSDPAVVHAATVAGAGIGVLPEFLCRQGLVMGKLERVLPDWFAANVLDLHAVCDLRRASQPGVQALIEFLSANMVPVLGKVETRGGS
jgi:DNA-binding transcriptional LysR family regulator